MTRLETLLPKSHSKPCADYRRVLSGIIFINRNGLRRCDAPAACGPHKALYNLWKWSGDKGGSLLNVFVTVGLVSDYMGGHTLLSNLPKADWLLGYRGYDA
jgi:hypothetical protein